MNVYADHGMYKLPKQTQLLAAGYGKKTDLIITTDNNAQNFRVITI